MNLLDIIAQAGPDTPNLLSGEYVIALVTAIIGAVVGALGRGAVQKREVGPQPFEVKEHEQAVSRRECVMHHSEFHRRLAVVEAEQRRLREDFEHKFLEMTEKGEARASRLMKTLGEGLSKVHSRIDELAKGVARLEGRGMRD